MNYFQVFAGLTFLYLSALHAISNLLYWATEEID